MVKKAGRKGKVDPLVSQGWRKVERNQGEIHGWGEGVQVEGEFLKIREIPQADGKPSYLVDIVNVDGDKETWGCPTMLRTLLDDQGVSRGQDILIVCTGKEPSKKKGRQPFWTFDLYLRGEVEE